MQKILVTGANGFVGHHLVQWLLQKGYAVMATAKGPSRLALQHPMLQYFELDFTDKKQVQKIVHAVQPDVLVHAGALTKPDACEQNREAAFLINVVGTQNLLEAAALCGTFFLFVSTDFVFKGTKELYTESDLPDPVNYYGVTKMEAERLVVAYPGSWAIVRPILIYGKPMPGKQNLLTMVAGALRKGQPLKLFTDQVRMPTYVPDLCWGLEKIIAQQAVGIFHFCGQERLTPYDVGIAVASFLKLDKGLIQPATAETFWQPAARPPRTFFDLAKVKSEFNFEPTPFHTGLHKTFEEEA